MKYREYGTRPEPTSAGGNRIRRARGDAEEDSGVRQAPHGPISPRRAALSFVHGAAEGWSLHQLVSWVDLCLIRPGRLITRYPFPRITIQEPEVGALSYTVPGDSSPPDAFLPHARAHELARCSRRKVVHAIEGMLRAVPEDQFVQAALYDGRVTRVSRGRDRKWDVLVTEEHALSEQVLALFAVDLLENQQDYEKGLVICSSCERVDFFPKRASRRACPDHVEAVLSTRSRANAGFGR